MAKPAVEAAEDLKSLHWDLRSKVGDWDPKCKNAGPCRVAGCGARPMQSPLTSDLSLRLSTWDSELTEACPQLAGECGGTWIASGATGGPVGRGPIFALDLAPCDDVGSPPSPTSPKVRIVPSVSKKLVLAYRNKESLVEEIIDLKRAVQDQQMHIQHHKIQASIIEMENRKMIRDIEDMEKPNCHSKATKPQGTVKLRARIQVSTFNCTMRMNPQEIEFERDVFAGEITRLTSLVKRLKQLVNYAATLEDRDQIGPMTFRVKELEDESIKLEEDNAKLEKEMAKTAHTLKWARIKANDDTMEARSAEKKCRDLEHANVRMAAAIEKTKKSNNQLSSHLKTTQKTLKKLKGSFF
nr:uncharacterized protein LOC112286889 isoform X2 [Physcomitrium patens]|eukprot:XP_024385024.1 uncharacterized protein LOC112286889 isoform X2 [Physcomitrella patens]